MGVERDFEISIVELFHEFLRIGEEIFVPPGPLAAIMRRYGEFTYNLSIPPRTLLVDRPGA